MASIVYNPNNPVPYSTFVSSTSYTIPAGYYARITKLEGLVSFSLNAANTAATDVLTAAEYAFGINGIYTEPFNVKYSGTLSRTSAGTAAVTVTFVESLLRRNNYLLTASGTTASGTGSSYIQIIFEAVVVNETTLGSGTNVSLVNEGARLFDSFKANVAGSVGASVAYDFYMVQDSKQISFWVKDGDVINIPTGGAFLVEQYAKIS